MRATAQMSSFEVLSQKIEPVNPYISFDFLIADIGFFKKNIDMNKNRYSKAERNDFEFDLSTDTSTQKTFQYILI